MGNLPAALFVIFLLVGAAGALLLLITRRRPRIPQDMYTHGLEQWLAGELQKAQHSFRQAIDDNPTAVDPYLQLGNLLRLTGDARRAAVLHRGLTLRSDVPADKRVSITLALASDLIELRRWSEAGSVLDSVEALAANSARYWRARFAQLLGSADEAGAARALQSAATRCAAADQPIFREQYELFQLDRALQFCRQKKPLEARRLLKDLPHDGKHVAKLTYVKTLIAEQVDGPEAAVRNATQGLVDAPQDMGLFLPTLQSALLSSGHFERTIPILETASRSETAPASLWIALALLYEKLGERSKAIQLLEDKAGDSRLTPNVAAPLLKLLAGEDRQAPWVRIWRTLHVPTAVNQWRCRRCGHARGDVFWFCPQCHSFESFAATPR